jgi:hypothetical protein
LSKPWCWSPCRRPAAGAGNHLSNSIIVIISLSNSLYVAGFARLSGRHPQARIFVNARIIGADRARVGALIAMLVMEAPRRAGDRRTGVHAYIKKELVR